MRITALRTQSGAKSILLLPGVMRSRFSRLLLLLGYTTLLFGSNYLVAPACARELEALSFKQTHGFLGKVTVIATGESLRIDGKGGVGFVLVAKAPEWQINIFRDDERKVFSESLADFTHTGVVPEMVFGGMEKTFVVPEMPHTRKTFMGFSIVQVRYPNLLFEFFPLPNSAAKPIAVILSSAYKTIRVDGFPVTQIVVVKKDFVTQGLMTGQRAVDLSTVSFKKVKVSSDIFELPRGYSKAQSVRDVVFGATSKSKTEDLKDLLEFNYTAK